MNSSNQNGFQYDVFISYSHHDRDWVRGYLMPAFKRAGIRVCIDYETFEPGAPSISEMERAVLQSHKTILVITPEYLKSGWTEYENILSQTIDPAARQRRLIPVLLKQCNLPLRIRMLTYIDLTDFGECEANIERLIQSIRKKHGAGSKNKTVKPINLPFEVPTGALSPDSPFYIERQDDLIINQQITFEGSTTIIEGARQMGKSSMMLKALAHACSNHCTALDFDFQFLDECCLNNLNTLLHYLTMCICERLKLKVSPDEVWKGPFGSKYKLTNFIEDYVLSEKHDPVVLLLDEVDRVFGRAYQDDFFALLRAWHNIRAKKPLWRKLNLVLALSSDPRQAIRDMKQSPFNVGAKIRMKDFSFDEIWELNNRYGRPLKNKNQCHSLMGLTEGHPYLAQQAMYMIASRKKTLDSLLVDSTTAEDGPFYDHLVHYRHILESDPDLQQGMRDVITNGSCSGYEIFERLRSIGLIMGQSNQQARPRCMLYREYFRRVFL